MTSGSFTTIRLTEIDPHVIVLSMNRPEQRNAINVQMAEELEACLFSLKGRQNLRALIITGEGTAFGAGADLKERATLSVGQTRKARDAFLRCLDMIEALQAPVIAMINGPAIGGAFELALACDIRIASDRAVFSLPEVSIVSAFPGAGGPVRLSRLVGRGRANLVILTGRKFSAEEAFSLGFSEVVVPHARLMDETRKFAHQIAQNNPEGVSAAKQLIFKSCDLDLQTAMELSHILRESMDSDATVADDKRP